MSFLGGWHTLIVLTYFFEWSRFDGLRGEPWLLKMYFTSCLAQKNAGERACLEGWLKSRKRCNGGVIFMDIADSRGDIQVVIEKKRVGKELFLDLKRLKPESALKIHGEMRQGQNGTMELVADNVEIVSQSMLDFHPNPREEFDVFSGSHAPTAARKKHLYMRNPQFIAVMR